MLERIVADLSARYRDENFAAVSLSAEQPVTYTLRPEESGILGEEASAKKRAEFLLGRSAANVALKKLGFDEPPPLTQGTGRQPLWPPGIVGSITHCRGWAVVVAAKSTFASAIGIDLENVGRMKLRDVGNLICLDSELEWASEPNDHLLRTTMLFAAKEAIFKAFYPCCGRYFDFKDVELRWDSAARQFAGQLLVDLCPRHLRGYGIHVGVEVEGDYVFSSLIERVIPNP